MTTTTVQTTPAHGLRSPLAWFIWGLGLSYVIYKFQTQSSFAVLNAGIAESLSLQLSQIGVLGAVYSITYAMMTVVAGGLLDRYGARIVLSVGAATITMGAMVFGIGQDLLTVIIGQALMGVGGAFGYPALGYLTRHWFSIKHFGVVFGIGQMVAAFAGTVGQAAVGYLLLVLVWREILQLEALIGFVLLIACIMLLREPGDDNIEKPKVTVPTAFWSGFARDSKVLLTTPLFWQVTLISGLSFGTMLGIGMIWGIKLLVFKGFDTTTASNINATIWTGFGIGAVVIHLISDHLRSFKLNSVIFLLVDIIALLMLMLTGEISVSMAYIIFLSIGFFASVSVLCYTMTTRFCEMRMTGTAFGLLTSASFVLGALLMALPARLIESTSLPITVVALVFPAALLLALCLALIKPETYNMTPSV